MDPPFHQRRHTSRARAHAVPHWTLKVWGRECPTCGPSHTYFLTEKIWYGHNISAMATSGAAPCRRKATPHTGEHNFLYHDGSLITCVALQGQVLSQSLLHTNTQDRISFGEKRCHSKHPNKITWTMKSRNDWGEHSISCHFNRNGLFRLGNI